MGESTRPDLDHITKLSPKARIALRSVVTGMKNTEAAEIADIHPVYVSMLRHSEPGKKYMNELDSKLEEKTLDTTLLLERLGHEAILKLAGLMRFSGNETLQLRAAQDLADRTPTTQKIQRHQVESFTLSGKDAKEIAEAMVAAATVKQQFEDAAKGDYIKVPLATPLIGET